MKTLSKLTLAAACTFAVLLPIARADEWNKETKFTFNGPVEIPGQILPAGTYVFKLVDSNSDRNIVRVTNEGQDHVFATVLAINNYRLEPKGDTVLMFEERAANAPQAVKAWFYPGDNYGQEFVYPKIRAAALAASSQTVVPSMPEASTVETAQVTSEPVPVQQQQTVEVAQVSPQPMPTQAPEPVASDTTDTSNITTSAPVLPSTASDTPLIALLGTLGLIAGGLVVFGTRSHSL